MHDKEGILIIENSHVPTGAFKSIFGFASGLGTDFRFHFAVPKNSRVVPLVRDAEFPYTEIPFMEIRKSWRTFFYLPVLLLNSWRVHRYIKRHSIRVVHVNDLYNMIGVVLGIFSSVHIIYHVRLLPSSYAGKLYTFWLKRINRRADHVIAVSQAVANALPAFVRKPQTVIYDFITLKESGAPGKEATGTFTQFAYLANYTKGKGQDLALQAFKHVYEVYKNSSLHFYGSTTGSLNNIKFREELLKESSRLNLQAAVFIHDAVDDVEEIMKKSDVILMFSESESFSLVTYEAMYYGRAVIASDCGGPAELITHPVSGMIVPNKDVNAMANAMRMRCENPAKTNELGENAYTEIRQKIVAHNALEKLRTVYRSVMSERT